MRGVLFLLHRAGLLAPTAALDHVSSAQRVIAAAIVQALGHLPLALDQAGAYLEETGESLSSYLTLYQEQRKAVLAYRGGLSTKHAPVATTWSLALSKLAAVHPAAIDLMRLCAFLSADAIAEEMVTGGAQHVSPALHEVATNRMSWNQMLEHLLTYSLVQRQPSTHTLSLHRLVQAVISDEMDAATRQDWVERAVRVVGDVFPSNEIAPWSLSQRYVLNALTCLDHAEQVQMESDNVWLLRSNVAYYLSQRGQYSEAEVLYQQVLRSREKLLGAEHPDTLRIRHNLANLRKDNHLKN